MKKWAIILMHLGYWLLYLMLIALITAFLFATAKTNVAKSELFQNAILFLTVFAILPALAGFYLCYAILFPRYLFKKKMWSLFLAAIVVAIICGSIGSIGLYSTYDRGVFSIHSNSFLPIFITMSINGLLNGLVALVIRGFITWYADIKWKEELSQKNHETELALVKSQLDPHFLFNTINNIDILIEKDQSTASLYLNKLSDIMRFMLYETKTDRIPLSKELTYIEKYIDLQKIRTANVNYVSYLVEGHAGDKHIAPMLFIPFIENAFKHAKPRKTGNAIFIQLKIEENRLIFICKNDYNPTSMSHNDSGGLGNGIIKKRLELLYPGKHTFEIKDKEETYSIKLILQEA